MNLNKYTAHLVALLAFAIITFIQFKPLFSGKVINQSDIVQYRGMSKEVADFRKATHSEPLWTNSMFGGMPAYQVSTLYPGNWMGTIDKAFHLFMPHPGGYLFMFFLGFFILLLCLDIDPWVALVGSLAFGFSSYFFIVLEVGHNSKANAMSYLAPILGGVVLLLRRKYWLGFAVTTLFMALELNANHPQVAYYGLLLFVLVFISYFVKALREKQLKPYFFAVLLFAGSFLLGVLPNAGSLMSTYEYGKYTTRGKTELTITPSGESNKDVVTSGLDKDYAVAYSYGVSESFSFLIPDFKGGGSGTRIQENKSALKQVDPELREMVGQFGAYFGPQTYSAGPSYIGAIVILLAIIGLFIIKHPIKWALLIATAFSIMLAWGRYFMPLSAFFLDHFPGYNKFRAVSIINVIAELCIPLLAVMAFDQLLKNGRNATFKVPFFKEPFTLKQTVLVSTVLVGGFCLLCAVMPDMVNSFTKEGEEAQITESFKGAGYPEQSIRQVMPGFMTGLETARKAIFTADAWRSLIFIILAGGCLFLYSINRLKPLIVVGAMGLFVITDGWPVALRYLNDRSFIPKSQFETQPMSRSDEQILQDKSLDYRVLNIAASPFQDATTSYYHKSIGGYHGAKLKKYDELIQFHLFKEIDHVSRQLPKVYASDSLRQQLFTELPVLNMLNTKYMIFPTREDEIVITNPEANGNAWLVNTVTTVASADSEIVALGRTDTKHSCLIQEKNKEGNAIPASYSARGTIRLVSYQPNALVYESESAKQQFAVFSEIYYPKGWKATLDGTPVPHYCVDYLLRGMPLPAGRHKIEFKFEPAIYKTGNSIAYAGSLLVLASVAAGLFFGRKKKGPQLL